MPQKICMSFYRGNLQKINNPSSYSSSSPQANIMSNRTNNGSMNRFNMNSIFSNKGGSCG